MSCSTCYEATLKACPSTIKVKAGLTPNTQYYWVIKTRSKLYQRPVTTDADGILTIDCSVFPDGSFNQYSGIYQLEIRKGDDYLNLIDLTIGEDTFTCVQMSFIATDGEGDNNFIYSQGGTSGSGGSGGTINWTDFTYDQLNGVFVFTGGSGAAATAIVTCLPSNIIYTSAIMNAEGVTFTHGPFSSDTCTEMTYFTPQHYHNGELESGPIVIAWRRQLAGSPYTALTEWAHKELTITRLARRWYRIQREVSGILYDLNMTWYNVGLTINLYDIDGGIIGQPTSLANLIEMWNTAPANANFQIIDSSTIGFIQLRVEPAESEQAYPMQYIKFDYL